MDRVLALYTADSGLITAPCMVSQAQPVMIPQHRGISKPWVLLNVTQNQKKKKLPFGACQLALSQGFSHRVWFGKPLLLPKIEVGYQSSHLDGLGAPISSLELSKCSQPPEIPFFLIYTMTIPGNLALTQVLQVIPWSQDVTCLLFLILILLRQLEI